MYKPAGVISVTPRQSGYAALWLLVWAAGMAAIAYVCLMLQAPKIESATQDRLASMLAAAPVAGVTSDVYGYTATLHGNVASDGEKQTLLRQAAAVDGVRQVVDKLTINGEVGNGIKVAKADASTPLIAKPVVKKPIVAKKPTTTASVSAPEKAAAPNTSKTTSAQPSNTSAAKPASNAKTTKSSTNEADINNTQATPEISKIGTSPNTGSSAKIAVKPEPKNSATKPATTATKIAALGSTTTAAKTQKPAALKEPSLSFQVDDGNLILQGAIANGENLNALVAQIKKHWQADFVINSTQTKKDIKPASWFEPVSKLIPSLDTLDKPGISIRKNQITLSGVAPAQEVHDSIINQALTLLGDYSLVERIAVKPPAKPTVPKPPKAKPAAKKEANKPKVAKPKVAAKPATNTALPDPVTATRMAFSTLPSTTVLFKSGRAVLTLESLDNLDNIAEVLAKYPGVKVAIHGHTDASGPELGNLKLSQARANAVRDYLTDQNISVYRLSAHGFGESVPIAKNDSPEGRAKNRRIEFKFR